MIGQATARYIRISPRKVRQVIDIVRGKGCLDALSQLDLMGKRAAKYVAKLLRSAIRNVEISSGHAADKLFISKVTADKGPTLKRFRARAMGRAAPILKRMSHIHVELDLWPSANKVKEEPEKPAGRLKSIGRRLKKKAVAAASS
jgi:large subunit ribosomal protein L22